MERRDDSQYTLQEPAHDPALRSMGAVADEAKEQVRSVADTAVRQTQGVLADIGSDLSTEAQNQKLRLAKGLEGFSTELEEVARSSSGRVPSLAGEAAARTRSLAQWLELTEGRDMVRSVEDFGRRRPVTFILGCALAGVAAGRLTRGIIDDRSQEADSADSQGAPVVVSQPAGTGPYDSLDASGMTVPAQGTSVSAGSPYGGVL
jgi:hypothetical protein